MIKNKKWLNHLVVTLVSLGILTGCNIDLEGEHQTKDTEPETEEIVASDEEEIEVLVKIYIDDSEQKEFTHMFEIDEGVTLLELMEDSYRLVEEDGKILCIEGNGQDVDEGKLWKFKVNDIDSEIGSGDYELHDGDVIEWKLGNN